MIKGRCECGKVEYEVSGKITGFSHCHCSQCRPLHGAAFATFGGVKRNHFRYLSGESSIKIYTSSQTNDRIFCDNCGSNILVDYKPEQDFLYIAMGTVENLPDFPPAYHQFVDSKAS